MGALDGEVRAGPVVNAGVTPVPLDELRPDVRAAIERGLAKRMLSTSVPVQQWAQHPDAAVAQLALYRQLFEHSLLDGRLLELVRLRVAALNDCEACSVARKSDDVTEEDIVCLSSDSDRFTPGERAALRFAELLVLDHHAIDSEVLVPLRQHFEEPEIVDLGLWVAMVLGLGRLNHALNQD
jgi:alkylhydroperoxidase family enzyme